MQRYTIALLPSAQLLSKLEPLVVDTAVKVLRSWPLKQSLESQPRLEIAGAAKITQWPSALRDCWHSLLWGWALQVLSTGRLLVIQALTAALAVHLLQMRFLAAHLESELRCAPASFGLFHLKADNQRIHSI